MKNKINKERIINIQLSYLFLFLATLLRFATNYLTNYLYDFNKSNNWHHLGAAIAFVIVFTTLFFIYKEVNRLDNVK